MLATANLRLHKVGSNSVEVMEAFPTADRERRYATWIFSMIVCLRRAPFGFIGTYLQSQLSRETVYEDRGAIGRQLHIRPLGSCCPSTLGRKTTVARTGPPGKEEQRQHASWMGRPPARHPPAPVATMEKLVTYLK